MRKTRKVQNYRRTDYSTIPELLKIGGVGVIEGGEEWEGKVPGHKVVK